MSTDQDSLGTLLTNRFGERYFPVINGEVFSQTGSDSYFQRHFGSCLENENALHIIGGTDSGLLVNWVLNKKTIEGARYIFLELPELIARMEAEGILPQKLPKHVAMATTATWQKVAEEFSLKDYLYIDRVFPTRSLAVLDGHHDGYLKLWNDFDEFFGQYRLQVGMEIGSRVFMLKGLENLSENRTAVACLNQAFKGKTAILMAGGPSLDESFHWVRTHRQNLVVLAVARIATQLAREKIVPDMAFAIDPHYMIFHLSKGILDFYSDTLLVNMYHLHPGLVNQWRGRSLFMGTLFPWPTELNPRCMAYPGITVSHQALGAAIEMGFSQIVLSGFDLCFNKEGFTHARGSSEAATGPYVHRSELWVETNGGWQAETSVDFFNAIPAMSLLAKYGADKGCEVINPAVAAVKVDHISHKPWEAITPTPLEQPAKKIILETIPDDDRESRQAHYQCVANEIDRVRTEIRQIRKLTDEALDCNARLFGRKGKSRDFKYKKRMDAIEASLDTDFTHISRLIKKWSVGEMLKLSRPDKEKDWSDEDIEETGRRYYEIYRDSATDLLKTLDETYARIRARQEEEKAQPNLKLLLTRWEKDNQFGRIHLLLDRQGQRFADFPEKTRQNLQKCIEKFQEALDSTENEYKTFVQAELANPREVLAKVIGMHRNKDVERLQNFLTGIEKGSLPNKDQYALLIKGLLAELKDDLREAMKHLRQVTDTTLLLESQKRMLSINLQQQDLISSRAVARRLAERSPLHIPIFADLLRLTGDKKDAICVYTDYLKIVQGDFVSQLKLGRLQAETGDFEGARQTFLDVLASNPDHRAAKLYLEELPTTTEKRS